MYILLIKILCIRCIHVFHIMCYVLMLTTFRFTTDNYDNFYPFDHLYIKGFL